MTIFPSLTPSVFHLPAILCITPLLDDSGIVQIFVSCGSVIVRCAHRGANGSCSWCIVGNSYLGITSGLPVNRRQAPNGASSFLKAASFARFTSIERRGRALAHRLVELAFTLTHLDRNHTVLAQFNSSWHARRSFSPTISHPQCQLCLRQLGCHALACLTRSRATRAQFGAFCRSDKIRILHSGDGRGSRRHRRPHHSHQPDARRSRGRSRLFHRSRTRHLREC